MDLIILKERSLAWIKKYRTCLLVLLVGVVLMLLPAGKTETETPAATPVQTQPDLQEELEQLLARLDGAGKVQVLLTQAQGSKTQYQTDENGNGSTDTVIVTDSDRSQTGLVQQVDPPVYLGAVVLCQGAGKATVRLAIVDAVAKATGLPSSKITVLKMK